MVPRHPRQRLSTLALVFVALIVSSIVPEARGQSSACLQSWVFEDLTAGGGPTIEGTPASLTWYQPGVGHRQDVWARGSSGALVHYLRIGTGPWLGETLPNPQHRGALRSDPVVVLGHQRVNGTLYYRHDVFLTNQNEELLHYWWSEIPPSGWHAENLTRDHGGPPVFSQPVARNSYFYDSGAASFKLHQDVYSVNLTGDLIRYTWEAKPGWRHKNLRADASGGRMNPFLQPAVGRNPATNSSEAAYHHVFSPDISGQLSTFWREPANGARWTWRNLTQVGGGQVHPQLGGYSLALLDVDSAWIAGSGSVFDVFGVQGTNLIRYWSPNLTRPWNSENVTAVAGFGGSPQALVGRPAVHRSAQTPPADVADLRVRYDVWARDSDDHLIHYWSSNPWSTSSNSGGVVPWQLGEDLTTPGRPTIKSDPQAAIRYPFNAPGWDPTHYVFGRNGNDLVAYCWDRSAGWDADILQSVSSPPGAAIDGDPALDRHRGRDLHIFVRGEKGKLLHFWK